MNPRPRPRLRQLIAADDGMSIIEFAFVVPILAILIIGILDFGMGLWQQMQVGNAARAGAQYVTLHGWDSTKITNAVQHATSLSGVSATPAPAQVCGCPNASSGVTIVTCGTTCTGTTNLADHYVTVGAQVSYTMILPCSSSTILPCPSGITNPMTLSATAIGRLYP